MANTMSNTLAGTIEVLDKGHVKLIDYMGSDHKIVAAARVSYGDSASKGDEADKRLLRYLLTNGHTSPFEQVNFTFLVKLPIFVARQWMRHRTWSYNEVSGRYTELPEDFYSPKQWRGQDTKNKQGSSGVVAYPHTVRALYEDVCEEMFSTYKMLLKDGVSRELARMVLPLSTYTEMYASVDLHNLLHFLKLRLDSHSQYEIRCYAEAMKTLITPVVPWTMEIWHDTQGA